MATATATEVKRGMAIMNHDIINGYWSSKALSISLTKTKAKEDRYGSKKRNGNYES
jgi:hypothetical protein